MFDTLLDSYALPLGQQCNLLLLNIALLSVVEVREMHESVSSLRDAGMEIWDLECNTITPELAAIYLNSVPNYFDPSTSRSFVLNLEYLMKTT
jgi:hypothetical protein